MIVKKIRKLCIDRNVTVAEVEREVGLGNGSIRRWDENEPGAMKLKAVADFLGTTTDELLKEEE